MKIVYVGNRPVVSIMCSGRVNYIFHKDNDFTQEVNDSQHVSQILRSVQHKFETITNKPKVDPVIEHHAIAEENEPIIPIEIDKPKNIKKVKELRVSGGLR